MKLKKTTFFLSVMILLSMITGSSLPGKMNKAYYRSWEKQLNEMNYLIMRTSGVNIINGLALTRSQVKKLQTLEKEVQKTGPPIPDMKGNASTDLVKIRTTYHKLIDYLVKKKPIPEKFKNRITMTRILESDIIKRSVLGAQKRGYSGKSCLKCHASPVDFPRGDITSMKTEHISDEQRRIIDRAHVDGMFGDRGVIKLWNLKSDVDEVLFSGQKYLLKNFKCCLIPPENLSNPTNIGQAFVTDQWLNYFKEARNVPDKEWPNVKQLFIIPIEDLIEATLPGISPGDKKKIIMGVEKIINDARKMDRIDFELQKKSLCLKLRDELNIDTIQRETSEQKDQRQFEAAMFLLFPGNGIFYRKLLK